MSDAQPPGPPSEPVQPPPQPGQQQFGQPPPPYGQTGPGQVGTLTPGPPPKKRRIWLIVLLAVGLPLLLIGGCAALFLGSLGTAIEDAASPVAPASSTVLDDPSEDPSEEPTEDVTEEPTEEPSADPTTQAPKPKPTPTEPKMTRSQENAVESAQSYLESGAFSKKGLIEQLEYEDYSTKDAEFAVNHLEENDLVDWNAEAAESAQSYLDSGSFSRKGLIEQLKYEGFTQKQAEYGVKQAGF